MEGLAAASSISAVVSLAGQTIDGIIKLHSFFKDVKGASRTIEKFLRDINLLINTIEDVRHLLTNVSGDQQPEDEAQVEIPGFRVAALEIQMQDCSIDNYEWLKIVQEHHPEFSSGTKASFKKFWVAVNKAGMQGISQEIRDHRNNIVASLVVLGR
jgi:hypothetical protein